jgi:hypothetical protein
LIEIRLKYWTRSRWLLAVGISMLGVHGCTRNELPLVPVRGLVRFAGGPCPAQGNVTFAPIEVEAGLPRRPGSAAFQTDGQFAVTSFQKDDGLLPGRYKVSVTCYSGLPDPTSSDPWGDVSYVPNDYQPQELIVKRDSDPIELTYDVPTKKKNR